MNLNICPFQVSRIFLAVNCFFFYLRLFRIYHASWRLGPKLVIFHKMVRKIIIQGYIWQVSIVTEARLFVQDGSRSESSHMPKLITVDSLKCPPKYKRSNFHRDYFLQIPEIVTFMFLLMIFILAYGVASHALIDPYRMIDPETITPLLVEIFFLPYWQMYGELSLDR